jgi:hypothetical protein
MKCGLRPDLHLGSADVSPTAACEDWLGPLGERLVPGIGWDVLLSCSRGLMDGCKGLNGLSGTNAA